MITARPRLWVVETKTSFAEPRRATSLHSLVPLDVRFCVLLRATDWDGSRAAFLDLVPPHARILEFGCGGGRDAAAMIAAGFDVDPTDGAPEIARKAEERLGRHVRVMHFDETDALDVYDAKREPVAGAAQHATDGIRANSVHPGILPPMRASGGTADPTIRADRMRFIPRCWLVLQP